MFKYILLFLIVFSKLSFADTEKISLDKLKSLMSEGVPLIDIRTAKEWQETGVIKDSHLITFFNGERLISSITDPSLIERIFITSWAMSSGSIAFVFSSPG